ncbi:MAG TPA: hypothetical protein VII45_08035, partial [Solirubrobacterales bacterium]
PRAERARSRARYDARFYAVAIAVTASAIVAKSLGADGFNAYPALTVGTDPLTLALAALVALSGLTPLRRKPRRLAATARPEVAGA